ncbi:hypothetical protein JKP88DRAFT_255724 [Tribonema minus]|uniref:NrS-1 polymerase-like helicase domain-containing protein n=1 Tax=Tribonema minus TaxID=303371 RepID=A0A835Z0Z4_9STRA|nr:hypothetical protein JKP88DRAFT_255724 [Tribonema minus]
MAPVHSQPAEDLPRFMATQMAKFTGEGHINVDALRELVADETLVARISNHDLWRKKSDGLLRRLTEYLLKADECGYVRVTYKRGRSFGRLTAVGPSLQSFPRPIRYLITFGFLYDVDIDCCHPMLFWQYVEKLGGAAPLMKAYSLDAKAYRARVMEEAGCDYEEAKALLQSACYGVPSSLAPSLQALAAEAATAVDLICAENAETLAYCEQDYLQKDNPKYSCVSLKLQGLENACLRAMWKRAKQLNLEPTTPMLDGFMPHVRPMQGQLLSMQDCIKRDTGFTVSLSIKEIPETTLQSLCADFAHIAPKRAAESAPAQEEAAPKPCQRLNFSLRLFISYDRRAPHVHYICNCGSSAPEALPIEEGAAEDAGREWNRFEQLLHFSADKSALNDRVLAFNRNHGLWYASQFFTVHPDSPHRRPNFYIRSTLSILYENLPEVECGKKQKDKSFITAWCKHPERRLHHHIQMLPPPLPVADDIFNTWDGFAAERLVGRYPYSQDAVNRIIAHNKVLVDNDDKCLKYQLDWQAQLIQQPGALSRVCITTVGGQGCGKSLYILFLGTRIIGMKLYSDCSPKTAFDHFNYKVSDKLLITVQEIKASDTYRFSDEIKKAIADDMKEVTSKGVDSGDVLNTARHWWTANNVTNPVKVASGEYERRFCVVRASNEEVGDRQYFIDLVALLDDPAAAMSWYIFLRDYDITGVHFENDRPTTEVYKSAQEANVLVDIRVLHSLAGCNELPAEFTLMTKQLDELFTLYRRDVIRQRENDDDAANGGINRGPMGNLGTVGRRMAQLAKEKAVVRGAAANGGDRRTAACSTRR